MVCNRGALGLSIYLPVDVLAAWGGRVGVESGQGGRLCGKVGLGGKVRASEPVPKSR